MRLRDVAREREHQRDRVLGGGDDVRLRRVGDDDAALGGGLDVDVVDADAGAADHPQVVGAADQLGGQLRRRADQDRVVVADALGELLVGPVDAEVDVEALAQEVDAGVGDLLLDEDLVLLAERRSRGGSGTPASRNTRCAAPTPAPCSTSWPSWPSDHLQAGERREDVERAEVAAVGDADDLALELVLAAVGGDAELAQRARDLAAVDRLRQLDRGDDVRALVGVAEELEAERGDAGARGAGQQRVALEDVLEPLVPRSCPARRRGPRNRLTAA